MTALAVNIRELINGGTVEWERLEFKKGWNPIKILHTISAFANDINNWGGGYIIIGIEEKDGRPILPPKGLSPGRIDSMQKELFNLCNRLRPKYFPVASPVDLQGKKILLIWAPGGTNRPYKAPESLSKNANYGFYIRRYSVTARTRIEEERELVSLSNRVPYDDQINHLAEITDLNLTLIKAHLAEIGSALVEELNDLPFTELCRRMNLIEGPDEFIKPKNAGLLFFNDEPKRFFRGAQIDIVIFEDEVGDDFTEKIFVGPLAQQVRSAQKYLKNSIIEERIHKVPGQAEAERFFNYPYEAVKEALVNGVYHRSYEDDSPVEVRIFPDRMEFLSFPGPVPPLGKDNLMDENISARKCRNRRIGDHLKELHLCEGRGTGFPKIRRTLKSNGSPDPVFKTDYERTYFLAVLKIHPLAMKSEQEREQVGEKEIRESSEKVRRKFGESSEKVQIKFGESPDKVRRKSGESSEKILKIIKENQDISARNMSVIMGISQRAVEKQLSKLKKMGVIRRIGPDKGGHWEIIEDEE